MWTGTVPHYTILPYRAHLAVVVALVAAGVVASAQGGRRAVTLIVTGGTVLTENDVRQVMSSGAIAINGTDIVTSARLPRSRRVNSDPDH